MSQLKSFTRCGEAFRLEKICKAPRTPAAWTVLGVVIHEVFVQWEISDRQIDVCEYFLSMYDRQIEEELERQPDKTLWQRPVKHTWDKSVEFYRERGANKDVPEYRQRCIEGQWQVLELPDGTKALELPFTLDFNGVEVRGALDRIQWWPEQKMAALEDLKTGSVDDEADARQLGVYALAAQEIYDIDLTNGRYWFTKLDRPSPWIDLRRYTREYLTEMFVTLDNAIDSGIYLPRPGKQCTNCGVKPYCREMGFKKL